MKLNKLNKLIENEKIYNKFLVSISDFIIENNYLNVYVTLPKHLYIKLFEVIKRKKVNGFYCGKEFEWDSLRFYLHNENYCLLHGKNSTKKVIIC